MKTNAKFDVVVIGAGPAGITSALRLLRLNYRVAIVEQATFPRANLGVSLSPGIWKLFQYLGALPLLQRAHYRFKLPAQVIWEQPEVRHFSAEARGPGIVVDRGQLDLELLEFGKSQGLEVYQPMRFEQALRQGNAWLIKLNSIQGAAELECAFVIDARGATTLQPEERIDLGPSMTAIWADAEIKADFEDIRVEACADGWLWGAPLTNGKVRQIAYVDPLWAQRQAPGQILSSLLHQSKLFVPQNLPAYAVQTWSIFQSVHQRPWEEGYVRVGEAAACLDPLSNTGVEKSVRQGFQAALAIHTVLSGGDAEMARQYFEERVTEMVVQHMAWTRKYYGEAWPESDKGFWKRHLDWKYGDAGTGSSFASRLIGQVRQMEREPSPQAQAPIQVATMMAELWGKQTVLSPNAQLEDMPCAVGNQLVMRKVLAHPGLDRRMALLGDVQLIPLLEVLQQQLSLGEIVQQWSQQIPFEKASQVALWLWQKGVLEEQA